MKYVIIIASLLFSSILTAAAHYKIGELVKIEALRQCTNHDAIQQEQLLVLSYTSIPTQGYVVQVKKVLSDKVECYNGLSRVIVPKTKLWYLQQPWRR